VPPKPKEPETSIPEPIQIIEPEGKNSPEQATPSEGYLRPTSPFQINLGDLEDHEDHYHHHDHEAKSRKPAVRPFLFFSLT